MYHFHWLDVFTRQPFSGNQLAVVPEADGLTDAQMQRIAKEFNISETVFLFPPATPDGTRAVRIFTPGNELPFAGHPTIGAAHVLATRILTPPVTAETTIVLEERVGPVRVRIVPKADGALFIQLAAARKPEFRDAPLDVDALAASLHLKTDDFASPLPRGFASCGTPFIIVPLRDTEALGRCRIDAGRFTQAIQDGAIGKGLDGLWRDHLYLIAPDSSKPEVDYRARMFAPALGIAEDPATGGAAVALAAYLAAHDDQWSDGTLKWVVEQGVEMGRPSVLYLEADKRGGEVVASRVGGFAVWIAEGQISAPPSG